MRTALRTVALAVTLPVGAIGCLGVLLSLVNLDPQRKLFAHSFVVRNRLGHAIRVTPIDGQNPERPRVVQEEGVGLLTPLPPFHGGGTSLEPGTRRLITYDSDDQLVTALLVESPNGDERILPIEWRRAEYEVASLTDLRLAYPQEVRAAQQVARVWLVLPLSIGAALSPLIPCYWWWRERKHGGNVSTSKG